ncbi:OmpA family protein [Amycolatopsis rhizosphaerae]|uniref:OmpA family protein n=1 Tax=Amycolatopsis rhizosphaerae TaxID=2053003 RepID=A0A557ZYH0_9PSEU|nr:OmpA family protein [Amycolatopsis rhizosphaerae]TVT17068.1 OmpA family protein [Amycolatopsis rhizosphaerae]
MSGTRTWFPVIAVLVTGLLAVAVVEWQGPALRAHLTSGTTPATDPAGLQGSLDRVLLAHPITFAPDSADPLDPRGLTEVARLLGTAPPGTTFEIGGHAAAGPGSEATALALSRARAERVARALSAAGVPSNRLIPRAYGDTRPTGRGDERRVEIAVR